MKQNFIQIIKRSQRNLVLGKILAWFFDGVIFSFLSTVAFLTWAHEAQRLADYQAAFLAGLGLVLLAMLVVELRTGTSKQDVARVLDEKLGFKDRLSSALMFSNMDSPNDFMLAHIQETNNFISVHAEPILPIPWPRRTKVYLLFAAIVFVSMLPHEDRARLKTLDERNNLQRRKRDAMKIVEQLQDIRNRSKLSGLTKLSSMLTEVQRAISEQMDIMPPRDEKRAPESDTASDSSAKKSHDEPAQAAMENTMKASSGDSPRLSQLASYKPVGRFDAFPAESYSEVFSELDDLIISDDFLTSTELQDLSEHIDDVAAKLGNFGYFRDEQASKPQAGPGPEYGQMNPDEANDPFKSGLAPLQYKAFSEFLKRYAAHIGEKALGKARLEKAARQESKSRGKVLNLSAPPPKDGKFAIQSTTQKPQGPLLEGTPEQLAKAAARVAAEGEVTSQSTDNSLKVTGGGTRPGGKGAGVGGAGAGRAPAPKVLPRASGGQYLPLEGKLSDGRSVIQIIQARGKKKLGAAHGPQSAKITYNEIFRGYALGAQAALASESVPLQMRDYVRQYFLSIRPKVKKQ